MLPQGSDAGPLVFRGVGCEKFLRSFVFINIAGCTYIFVMRDTGYGTRDTGTNSKIGFIFTGTLTPGPGIMDVFPSFLCFHQLLGISLQGKN
jgi:hypothetical protein